MALFGKIFKKSQDDIEREYDNALALLNSDELQNKKLPENIREQVLSGDDCDVISGATGEFGRCATNPIPCNGLLGEWTYLSRLRLRSTGDMMFFHKVKCIDNKIDVFELISTSGQFADILYADMYHPRKSRLSPTGYIQQFELVQPRGILEECPDFPMGLFKLIEQECKKLLKLKAGEKKAKQINLENAAEALEELCKTHKI